ncbi:MAG TPA: hypothetical protein VIJ35_01755 [Bradyrhizobium sp.]
MGYRRGVDDIEMDRAAAGASHRGHCDNTGVEGHGIGWISKSSMG